MARDTYSTPYDGSISFLRYIRIPKAVAYSRLWFTHHHHHHHHHPFYLRHLHPRRRLVLPRLLPS